MKNILTIALFLAFAINASAQDRLADKRYPVHLVTIIQDKHQQEINVDKVTIEEKSGKKIDLKKTADGTYECYALTEEETDYTLLGKIGHINFNGGKVTLPAMSKRRQQMITKTLGLSLSKEKILSMKKKQDEAKRNMIQYVTLQINVNDETGQPLEYAQVSMYDESINLKIEDLKMTSKGVYETKMRQDHAHTYQFKIKHDGKLHHKVNINIPAANNEAQFVRKTFVCYGQNMVAKAKKSNDKIKSVGANQALQKSTLKVPTASSKIVLWKVKFENKYSNIIAASTIPVLEDMFWLFKNNPSKKFVIDIHTDNVKGTSGSSMVTRNQCEALFKYFTQKGIPSGQISFKSKGASHPMASNDDEKNGRNLNRRIEIKIAQ